MLRWSGRSAVLLPAMVVSLRGERWARATCWPSFYCRNLKDGKTTCASGPAVFVCPVCGDCLSSQDYLDKHMLDCHAERPRGRLECCYCPYTSNKSNDVTRHERTHTGERPFVCHLCRKGFTQKGDLRRHLWAVHTRERPHKCEVCSQRFTRASYLAQHRRVMHMRDTPSFACPQCGKGFTQKGNLNTHLLTHTGKSAG